MSGIALVLHERGFTVTGSDLKTSRYVRQLTRAGVSVRVGHEAATIDEVAPDVVVVSTAIPESNPELARARELGIPVWHRAKMLSALGYPESNPELARARELGIPVWHRAKMLSALGYGRVTVAAAGTHGKTTTSSMVATMLDRMGLDPSFLIGGVVEGYGTNGKNGDGEYFVVEAGKTTTSSMVATMLDRMGLDPSFLIGGVVEGYGTNGKNGDGEYFVVEADESDSSFLYLDPHVVIVTNVEADHMDHYSSLDQIERTFCAFMDLVGEDGTAPTARTATASTSWSRLTSPTALFSTSIRTW